MTVPPVFNRYLEQAMDFARRLVRTETGTRRWATVTAVDPVRITYDGPAPQGIIPPVVLGVPVKLGDRVRAHTIHDKTYITLANPTRDPGAPYAVAAGVVTGLPSVSNGSSTSVTVTFPPGRFSAPPTITANASNGRLNIGLETPSLSGVKINLFNWSGGGAGAGASLHWHAVQMTPTSAEG